MADSIQLGRLLGANDFFSGLGPEAIEAVARLCVTRSLGREEILFEKDDPADALYAVRRGQIRIATGSGSGRRLTLNLLGPGDVFGEVALLDAKPRTADAIAVVATELYVIRRRDFLDLLARRPLVAIRIIELLCQRIRWMADRMEEASLVPVSGRLARRLVALAEDYGAELTVSQEELAGFVGASRETVNRQLQLWKRCGLVELGRGRVVVLDPAALGVACEGALA